MKPKLNCLLVFQQRFFELCKFGKKIGKRSGIDNTFRQGTVSATIIATRAWA